MKKLRSSPPLFAPGETIGGCRIAHRAGTGAMGEVYLAEHLRLQRPVAVKVLLENKLREGNVERFLREAKFCSRIDHPNVVKIYDIGQDRGLDYIIMQYVDGMNLAQIVADQGGRLPWRHGLRIIRSAARGLHAVHEQGLVHRDIKPANIMLSRESRVLLMDFGMVREDSQTDENRIVGTPAYMSPEQCLGPNVDPRSDIFSMGGTLYYLLSGVTPFRGSVVRLTQQIKKNCLAAPRFDPSLELPTAVEEAVDQAMANDPDARFPNAKAMADHLTVVLERCAVQEISE